jgi:hypothetical protein
MATLNPREEIVSLLRGFFACPIITSLGKQGILDRFVEGPFTISDFPAIEDQELFQYVLEYLMNIGLLERDGQGSAATYRSTELGTKVYKRYGSFILLHSYRSVMYEMESLLFEGGTSRPQCDRLENVIGSGLTNGRKFFPRALDMLRTLDLRFIGDVGCGDGGFLSRVIEAFPEVDVVASDISDIAIKQTLKNLRSRFPQAHVSSVLTDAMNVELWAGEMADRIRLVEGDAAISMWYLVHEISRKSVDRVVDFFGRIHSVCPRAHIIVGEIVNIDTSILSEKRHGSIMPEFLLFHDISGQGVLNWGQYQTILERIPYRLQADARFDLIETDHGEVPTGFIWHLCPEGHK